MIEETIARIKPTENADLRSSIQAHLNDLTKPMGSLGRLEEFALQCCLCAGSVSKRIEKCSLFTFAADHGITEEKVNPFPREVTFQMVMNMVLGGAAVSVMCKNADVNYRVVDMGVDGELPDHPLLIKRKVARGTANFAIGPAMTVEQCRAALEAGIDLAHSEKADLIGVGEMGIGNSSSASALYALMLHLSAGTTVGAGTGAVGDFLTHKKDVVGNAVALHQESWDGTAFDALCRVGGYEIAGIVGMFLGSASKGTPVVVDGFISTAAAMVALGMAPVVREYLFFSHASAEHFHQGYLAHIKVRPVLNLDMRLGEGTGAVLAIQIIRQAMNCYHQMATFSGAGVANKG